MTASDRDAAATNSVPDHRKRGVDRGQIHPAALTPRVAGTGPALLVHHFLIQGGPILDELVIEIVDEVVMPLLIGRPGGGS